MESKIFINSTDTKFTETSNDQRFLLTQSKWSTENEEDKQLENLKKSIKGPNSISSIYSAEDFEKRNWNYNIIPNLSQTSNLYEIIKSNYLMKVNAQVRFETSREVDKRIGRPSNYKLETSSQINNGFVNYLEQKLMQLVTDHSRWFRSDQLNTEYFRIVKKIPYYFIENWSTKALYKETDISNWVKSYIEAASAFHFSQGNYSQTNWVERVVEFSVIFFSKAKWSKLVSELMSNESPKFWKHLETQKTILKIRSGMSAYNLAKITRLSPTMKSFFEISLQILYSIYATIKNNLWDQKRIMNHDNLLINFKNMKMVKTNKRTPFIKSAIIKRKLNIKDDEDLQINRIESLIDKTKEILNIDA